MPDRLASQDAADARECIGGDEGANPFRAMRCLGSSEVEHAIRNREVVGSNPTLGLVR